jgi:hypothetical protein
LTTFNKLSSNRPLYNKVSPVTSSNPLNSRLNFSTLRKTKITKYITTSEDCKKILEDLSEGKKVQQSKIIYKKLNSAITNDKDNVQIQLRNHKYLPISKRFSTEKSSEVAQLTNIY